MLAADSTPFDQEAQTKQVRFRFNDIRADLVGRRVTARAYISGESVVKAVFARYRMVCSRCRMEREIDASADPRKIYALLTSDGEPPEVGTPWCEGERVPHWWVKTPIGPPLTYRAVILRDSLEADDISSARASGLGLRGYLFGEAPASKDVEVEGVLLVNPRTNDIELMADVVRPAAGTVESFELEPEEVEALRARFSSLSSLRALKELAAKANPRVAGREHAKLAVILAYLSPAWISINGLSRPGTLRVLLFGDPRQGKGSVGDYLRLKLGLGKHAIGETSSRTGITYTIDAERGMVVWGVMVEADRGLVVLEALHRFPADDMATMRETMSRQYVEVRRSFSAWAWARTRVVADSNSRMEMGLYPYACAALRDLPCFKDQADITRWDIAIPFRAGDIDADRIVDATLGGEDDRDFLSSFKALVLWAWTRKPEWVRFTRGALEDSRIHYRDLLSRFASPDIPVVHEDTLLSLLRVAASFAALTFSSPDGVALDVSEGHVRLAKEYMEEVLEMLEIEDYKALHDDPRVTEDDRKDYAALLRRSELASKILETLASGPNDSGGLSEETGHEAPSVRRMCAELKGIGVVERVSAGYRLTRKGIQLWKEFHVTKVTDVTENRAPPPPGGVFGPSRT